MRHAYDEAVYTTDTQLIYTCITLPVRHAYDEAVYTLYTQLIYTGMNSTCEACL